MKKICLLFLSLVALAACRKSAPSGYITATINGQYLTFDISAGAATPAYGGDSGRAISVQGYSANNTQHIEVVMGNNSRYLAAGTYTFVQDSLYGDAALYYQDYQNDTAYYASAPLPIMPGRRAVTVIITSLSSGWMQGTFYGSMLPVNSTGNQILQVVNGKFSVPISLMGNPSIPWK